MNAEERRRLNEEMKAMMNQANNAPDPDREGLSPAQFHRLINYPLAPESWFGFRANISDQLIERMPIMRIVVTLLKRIEEASEIKLTGTGNFPRKLVQELYQLEGPLQASSLYLKSLPMSELDWPVIQEIHFIVEDLGWCKKRTGKFSLTAKGRKILAGPRQALFEEYVRFNLFRVNLGWRDGYQDAASIQHCLPFTLFLLHKYGTALRSANFYAKAFLKAFPVALEELGSEDKRRYGGTQESSFNRVYDLRMFSRYLYAYGWIKLTDSKSPLDASNLQATELFYDIFEQRQAEDLPPTPDHAEREINTALFDAEMGGISHFSDEVPLEMIEAFQDHIRNFHEQELNDQIPIRALLPEGFQLLPPDEVTTEKLAKREIKRVLAALEKANFITAQPKKLNAQEYYPFLYMIIIPTEITPAAEGAKMYFPFEEFLDMDFMDEEEDIAIDIAEMFLLSAFNLENDFPLFLLANEIRLGPDVVSQEQGMAHLQAWRSQYREIIPLAFEPESVEEDEAGFIFPVFKVAYRTIQPDGTAEDHEGAGLVQLVNQDGELKVQGAQFPNFMF